jgi:uncharacterized protein YjbI with pentapeptide repeats
MKGVLPLHTLTLDRRTNTVPFHQVEHLSLDLTSSTQIPKGVDHLGVTRYDIEHIQTEAGEEGTPDISFHLIRKKDDEGKEIDYRGLDIHHNLADLTQWKDLDLTRLQAPHASLIKAKFQSARLDHANFDHADMRETRIKECWLADASFLQARLQGTCFMESILTRANLGAASLTQGQFHFCPMTGVNLSGALLQKTMFQKCDLRHADLRQANLTHANFIQCDLTEANLFHANLTDSDFTECILERVEIAYADMTGVCITLDQLRSANLLHIQHAFETIGDMRSRGALMAYRDNVLLKGLPYSLPAFLGMALVPNGPAHCIEQFSHGLIPKKNEAGEIDGRYSDQPVRTILLEWIENWLSQ